jgi:serine/threonine protein kinase
MRFLGKYDSVGVLGRGGMGQVHAAQPVDDPATTVVVKVMRQDLADTPRARENFEREVKYTARLRHPYAVRVLDAGTDRAVGPCIVMEFVPGITLEQLLKKEKRLDPRRAATLIGCVCHALEAAHHASVVHRDLKPGNLMVVNAGTSQEHLKVMDFGLAYLASKPHLTKEEFARTGDVHTQGTPAYIAPELLRGDTFDGRVDLYSSGVVLFEMLAGQPPFPEDDVNVVVNGHLRKPPPTFASLGIRDVPAAVEDVVRHCLAKYPAERPMSPRALADELGRALGIDVWADTTPIEENRNEAEMPVAEDVPPDAPADPNTLVRETEAWMPNQVAVIKLGGFLSDSGGEMINSQPGLLQARFPPVAQSTSLVGWLLGKGRGDGIDLDLNLDKPKPTESRLIVTAVFRVTGGGPPKNPSQWTNRCLSIFEQMKRYLMGAS